MSEDFEDSTVGNLPDGWGSAGTANNWGIHHGTGPWALWKVQDGHGLDESQCAIGRRIDLPSTMKHFYMVMPPMTIPAYTDTAIHAEFSFCYRLERADTSVATVGLRVRGLEDFPMQSHYDLHKDNLPKRQFTLFESVVDTVDFCYTTVTLDDSLEGKFLHLAFEIFSASDTTVRVCIDDVACKGYEAGEDTLKPEIPQQPSFCFDPVVAADKDGNIHLAFNRVHWQPEACVCRDQIYYARCDVDDGWCTPVHVDSSGVGERNWLKTNVGRKGSDPALAVDGNNEVHVAWTDEGRMNIQACGDDVFYISRPGDAAIPSWRDSMFTVLSDDGDDQGAPDTGYGLQPDLAIGPAGKVIAVFHGTRYADRGVPTAFMRIFMRQKAGLDSSWHVCTLVPDSLKDTDSTFYDVESLDCRCPMMDIHSDGSMHVAYTWNETSGLPGAPEALALAEYAVTPSGSGWVPYARIMRDLRDAVSVKRNPAVCFDSLGTTYLYWCENDAAADSGAVMHMSTDAEGDTCPEGFPRVVMDVAEFTRGLCPSDDDSLDSEEKTVFEILLTIMDGDGIPLPGVAPDSFYVTVIGDTAGPADTCFTLNDAGFGRVDSTYSFWCESNDTLFATDTTGVQGETWITVKNISGKARLRLQAYFGASPRGAEDTVWINSLDQIPFVPDGKVTGREFSSFGTARNNWVLHGLESWVWDIQHHSPDVCTTGGRERPIFDVDGGDFSYFSFHYLDSLETDACDE